MSTLTMALTSLGRFVRGFVLMKWQPIPFFGLALTLMLLFWVYLAIARVW